DGREPDAPERERERRDDRHGEQRAQEHHDLERAIQAIREMIDPLRDRAFESADVLEPEHRECGRCRQAADDDGCIAWMALVGLGRAARLGSGGGVRHLLTICPRLWRCGWCPCVLGYVTSWLTVHRI